jgi:hypothetical protein
MPNAIRDDVQGVLLFMGFREIRPSDAAAWTPTGAVDGRYGTTSETKIIHRKHKPVARLVDAETGETVAVARRSCPVQA